MTFDESSSPADKKNGTPLIDEGGSAPKFKPRIRAMYSLLIVVVCVTVAEVLLKMGADATAANSTSLLGFSALVSWYTIVGIVFHISAFASWLYTLKSVPLSIAFTFTSVQQVTVPLAAWKIIHEQMSVTRLAGIAVVIVGVLLLVPAIVAAEHRAEGES